MDVTIRSAEPDDAIAIGKLIVQLGYDITVDAARRRIVQLTGRADHALLVASSGAKIVGVIHICVIEALEHEPRGEIRALSVDEEHRSGGVGGRLVDAAERWARERRLSKMRVRSNVKRLRARTFYERLGYVVTKTQNVFDKTL